MAAITGFTVQKGGYTGVPEIFLAICQDLVSHGAVLNFPATLPAPPVGNAPVALFKATMEIQATDPAISAQPWRIQFDASVARTGSIVIATPIQLPNDGSAALLAPPNVQTPGMPAGMLNTMVRMPSGQELATETTPKAPFFFIYRSQAATGSTGAGAYPLSYRLTLTERGIALCVWEDATDAEAIPNISWVVAQRPVDHLTGATLVAGHAPVVCVYGMAGVTSKFIVRENDVYKPTLSVSANTNTEDSRGILNTANQVSITENNRYVITFPNGLNTPRYSYTEELDMVAYTSADVVSEFSNVPLTVYGEGTARTYKALRSTGGNSTGMRLLFLTEGGGVPVTP